MDERELRGVNVQKAVSRLLPRHLPLQVGEPGPVRESTRDLAYFVLAVEEADRRLREANKALERVVQEPTPCLAAFAGEDLADVPKYYVSAALGAALAGLGR